MKSSELRKDNYIQDTEGFIFQVNGITTTGKVWIKSNYLYLQKTINLNDFKPMPLTEEWLLKLGFIGIDDDGLFESEKEPLFQLQNIYLANDGYDFIFDTSIISEADKPIKYVHQLQNLYFAVIQAELTIK